VSLVHGPAGQEGVAEAGLLAPAQAFEAHLCRHLQEDDQLRVPKRRLRPGVESARNDPPPGARLLGSEADEALGDFALDLVGRVGRHPEMVVRVDVDGIEPCGERRAERRHPTAGGAGNAYPLEQRVHDQLLRIPARAFPAIEGL
jgi:hypothetical protein